MINNYKLNRLYIENFKLIKDKLELDFSDKNLIVLDGPNGYGKTTIFDAIEIIIKGQLQRLKCIGHGEKSDKPVIFANDIKKPVILKAEFINTRDNEDVFCVIRKIDNPSCGGKLRDDYDVFHLLITKSWSEEASDKITQEKLNEKLGFYPDETIYNTMYYIEQEDTINFLQQDEKKRQDTINKYFNISKFEKKKNIFGEMRTVAKAKYEKIGGKDGNEAEIGKINNEIEEIKGKIKRATGEIIEYQQLIAWKKIEWDDKNFIWDDEKHKVVSKKLNFLESLLKYPKDYNVYLNNKDIYKLKSEEYKVEFENIIIAWNYVEKYHEIKNKFNLIKKYKNLIDILNSKDLDKLKLEFEENIFLDQNLLKEEENKEVNKLILQCVMLKSNSTQFSQIVSELKDARENFNRHFEKYLLEVPANKDQCPFCGFDYSSLSQELLPRLIKKEKYFTDLLDEEGKKINDILNIVYKTYLDKINEELQKFIELNAIDEKFLINLEKVYLSKNKIEKVITYLNKIDIDLTKYCLKSMKCDEHLLDKKITDFYGILDSKIQSYDNEFLGENDFEEMEVVLRDICDSDMSKLQTLTSERITNFKKYLDGQLFSIYKLALDKNQIELTKYRQEYDIFKSEYDRLDNIYKIYNKEINSYFANMIKQLQIPFFIYTGKILQDYQGGLGVFIKNDEGDTKNKIRFLKDYQDSHDIINQFSSGQLSGIVIALVLALNQVFGQDQFASLFIDDPMQCMDDINMASFVEILRGQFKDKQIFISTHEADISRYFRYKFNKSGLKTMRYNARERKNQ